MNLDPSRMTDAGARNLVIKSLRQSRATFRAADTAGEALEREFDRLIKRKTRITSASLVTLSKRYDDFLHKVESVQIPLTDAFNVTAQF